jgi:hypothetical protein
MLRGDILPDAKPSLLVRVTKDFKETIPDTWISSRASMDTDLEAFSHNPTDGGITP